ncbi:MAG: glycerol-3-phosphate 1-O-acyltransferase PlsY [Nitrospirales bacterium]
MGPYIMAVLGAYVLGSIPFGIVVAKIFGTQDPRTLGSQNIGFTNVLRVNGKKAGFLTLLGDMGKGLLATGLAQVFGLPWVWVLIVGIAVLLGHIFSVFLKFQGGKGVATALGSVLAIDLNLGLCLLGIWIGTVILFQHSSSGALASFGIFPVIVIFGEKNLEFVVYALCVTGLIFYRHMENIIRLINGTESKITWFNS